MKKSLALLAIATLLIGASGCGSCRGLFGRSCGAVAGPVYSRCAPMCAPACNTCGTSSCAPICSSGASPSCGCESSTPVTYGYNGPMVEMPASDGTVFESTPMTVPTGSGSFGQ